MLIVVFLIHPAFGILGVVIGMAVITQMAEYLNL